MNVTLAVIAGPHAGKSFRLDQCDSFMIGRSDDSHLKFTYDDPFISRKHCLLQYVSPCLRLLDLNSRNGVKVNGKRVANVQLADGDEIELGHTKIRVKIEREQDADLLTLDLPHSSPSLMPTLDAIPLSEASIRSVPTETGRATVSTLERARIDGYELQDEIGRGGMGVVHRARRLKDGMPVAIKQLLGTATAPARDMQRFLREAKILASINHPNIVRLFEAGSTQSGAYIVMELVEGPDVKQILSTGGPLYPSSAVRLTRQILAALAAAHSAGFVHRDVKPSNVLLGQQPDGRKVAKLADFGLARAYDASKISGLTIQGEIGGTPLFMAPEQITHYRDVTPAADQYSAAATLYYLLTGSYPIEPAADSAKTLVKILTEVPVPLKERIPSLPEALSSIIAKAMDREPHKRYANALEFREALRPFAKT